MTPVRDWSIRVDLFAATAAASADTRKFATPPPAKDTRELIADEYPRPIPAPSDYSTPRASPMPWGLSGAGTHTTVPIFVTKPVTTRSA